MKFRIDWQRMRSDPLHLRFVIAYAIAGSVLILLLADALYRFESGHLRTLLNIPYVSAGGIRIGEGLKRFRGLPVGHSWNLGHTLLLLSTILTYVVLPPLFVWSVRMRARWREMPRSNYPRKLVVFLGLTWGLVFLMIGHSIVAPFLTTWVFRSLHQAQKVQSNVDVLLNDLAYMGIKAQSFYLVPTSDGGGGGRWLNIQRKSDSTLTLREIEPSEPVWGKIWEPIFPQVPSRFVLEVHGQDSLSIWGVGSESVGDTAFVNKDGRRGMLEWRAIVTPTKYTVLERNSN